MFWKTLIAFDFDEILTQRFFLLLRFAVGQGLSISGYDFENGRMPCKQKYRIKNMAVKISILILFHLRLLCCCSSMLF